MTHIRNDPGPLPRIAGALYLVIIVCGIWSEGFARVRLIVPGDAAATAQAIAAAPGLLPLSVAADTMMALADIALAVVFLALLRPVGPILAPLAAAFRLVQAALIGASLILLAAVPGLVADGEASLALLFARMHATGYDIGLIFFGANSLIMAVLLRRSGGAPAGIAYGIAAAGVVYLAGSYARLVAPDLHAAMQPAYVVPLLAETALCLWLLLRGRV